MRGHITNSIRSMALALFVLSALVIAGCGDESPVAPDPNAGNTEPPEEIKTPRKMRIDYVLIESVALVNSDGDNWDLDPFTAANRRPDIFLKLGNYVTNVIGNYFPTNETQRLNFSAPAYGRMNYGGSYTIELYDEDSSLQGSDDRIARFTFRPDSYYRQDNATRFTFRITDGTKFSGWAYGVWIY